jgi:hypothetical protein
MTTRPGTQAASIPMKPSLLPTLRFLLVSITRLAWHGLKNLAKMMLGRERPFDAKAIFLRQSILHLTGIRPFRALTCVRLNGNEGAGSQAHMIINAISVARLAGLTYVHTPFQTIHHADRPMGEWTALWESFFNLGEGEVARGDWQGDVVNYCYNWREIEFCLGLRNRREEQIASFRSLLPELRRKFYQGKLASAKPSDPELTVAAHIRRGDVNAINSGDRFIALQTIQRTLNSVSADLTARGTSHRIRIFSQGEEIDFAELRFPGAEFHLDTDPAWTMRELSEADILIMDTGFFSFYPALISKGIKIFYPQEGFSMADGAFLPSWAWQHRPQADDWLACNKDGSLSPGLLLRQLG